MEVFSRKSSAGTDLSMKIAVVFDDLIQFGGAERLLLAIHDLYPEAPVYTSHATREWAGRCDAKNIRLHTSFMQVLPFKKYLNRLYGMLGLHIMAFESFNFNGYDIVLSVSARYAHGILTQPGTIHICYINSPGRMFWEPWDYFERERFMESRSLRILFRVFSIPFLSLLRLWDFTAAQRVDHFIANSKTPQDRVKKYYRRDSRIIYPFSEIQHSSTGTPVTSDEGYFLVITRLNSWKRVDLAVDACYKAGFPLKIIGDGPDKKRLVSMSGGKKGIELLGYVSDRDKELLIKGCRALIITQKEDFGITALEAMSLGKPVIAYRAGGVLETIKEGVTGEFFEPQCSGSLEKVLRQFDPSGYNATVCMDSAKKFSRDIFLTELDGFIKNVYYEKNKLP